MEETGIEDEACYTKKEDETYPEEVRRDVERRNGDLRDSTRQATHTRTNARSNRISAPAKDSGRPIVLRQAFGWGSESQPSHSSQKSQSEAVVWKFSTDDRPFPTFLTAHAFRRSGIRNGELLCSRNLDSWRN